MLILCISRARPKYVPLVQLMPETVSSTPGGAGSVFERSESTKDATRGGGGSKGGAPKAGSVLNASSGACSASASGRTAGSARSGSGNGPMAATRTPSMKKDGDGDGGSSRLDAGGDGERGGVLADGGAGLRRLADQRGGQELLDDAVSLLAGVRAGGGVPGAPDSSGADGLGGAVAGAGEIDMLSQALSGGNDDLEYGGELQSAGSAALAEGAAAACAAAAADAEGGEDGSDAHEAEDEELRAAVKTETANTGLTQHTVAVQAGISQPVLCTYLGGKSNGRPGAKNPRVAVRTKLLAWLGSRGFSPMPIFSAEALTPEPAAASPVPALPAASAPPSIAAPAASTSVGGFGPTSRAASGASGGGGGGGKGAKGADSHAKSGKSHVAGGGASGQGKSIKLTPQHLHVAYIWYIRQRDAEGVGLKPGEEEAFCLKCKDGGDVLLCDYGGCTKSYHVRCCGLKTVPEGIWECPRHRCIKCGAGPSRTDASGKPRQPDIGVASNLWPCRTCPITYCERCLPEEVSFAGEEIVCESCAGVLQSDVASLQLDLIRWKPEMFAR